MQVDAGKVIEALSMKIAGLVREQSILEVTVAALQARIAEAESAPGSE